MSIKFHKKKFDKNCKNELNDLLVFGYSCRLYQPHLEHIDVFNQNLISWNDDESVKIDRFRYDCRLYLNSLTEFDNYVPSKEENNDFLTAEKLEEELCDEERYKDLYDELKKTEEDERLKRGKGAEIGFSYNDNVKISTNSGESSSSEEEIQEPYVVPEGLKLPVGMNLPDTMKQSAIIEKTAMFVVAKGPQMEIVIKLKQRNNLEQFGFLEFDNKLNAFYKYICKLIREKKYTPNPAPPKTRPKAKKIRKLALKEAASTKANDQENERNRSNALNMIALNHRSDSESNNTTSEDEDRGYLHPLLMSAANKVSNDKKSKSRSVSPAIGPMPKQNIDEPKPPDFDEVFAQLQKQIDSTDNVYLSLYKSLNSIIPGNNNDLQKEKVEEEENKNETENSCSEIIYETDEEKIKEYNEWHSTFYGFPSRYLPLGPPIPIPPPPNLSSPLKIAARYVALNGSEAEQKLIDHNGNNCFFLFPTNSHYTYYQLRVRQIQWSLNQMYLNSVQKQQQSEELTETQLPLLSFSEPPRPPINISLEQQKLMPTEMSTNNEVATIPIGLETNPVLSSIPNSQNCAEINLKQERKERARLFMEKILNEKLAAKKRQQELQHYNLNQEKKTQNDDIIILQSHNTINQEPSTSSGNLTSLNSPTLVVNKVSELIHQKIQNVLTASSLLISSSKKEKEESPKKNFKNKKKSEKDQYEDRYQKSRHKKSRKRSKSHSFSDSESDYKSRHYRHKSKKFKKKHSSSGQTRLRSNS